MGSDSKKPRAACVEDYCDEDEKVVRGTKQSASSKGKSKGERQRDPSTNAKSSGSSKYSSQVVSAGEKSSSSKSARVEVVKVQSTSTEKESRRRSIGGTTPRSPTKLSRPGISRSNVTSPPRLDTELPSRPRTDPSYFGVSPKTTYTPASSSSARSARPVSYYEGMPAPIAITKSSVSRPPLAPSAFYVPPSTMGVSYPQTSPTSSYLGMTYSPLQTNQYYPTEPLWPAPNPLAARFTRGKDPINRTASAQGVRTSGDFSAFDIEAERRNIVRRRAREAEDMTPPLRRDSVTRLVDNRDIYDDAIRYDSRPARALRREPSPAPRPPRRPSANRSSTYGYPGEQSNYRIETSNQARRASYYDGQRVSSDYEDKVREAAGYQEEVAGGPPVSLTAEALRKQQRTTASSRSTRSSGSRDESDYRRSATTRTTTSRFEGDGENVTIKFKGDATINIAGAEIKCDDGAELNITRSKGSIRNGSERGGSEYGMLALDDRRSRDPRSSNYSRSSSKSRFSNALPTRAAYQHTPFF